MTVIDFVRTAVGEGLEAGYAAGEAYEHGFTALEEAYPAEVEALSARQQEAIHEAAEAFSTRSPVPSWARLVLAGCPALPVRPSGPPA